MLPSTHIADEQQYLTVSTTVSILEGSVSEDAYPTQRQDHVASLFTEASPFFYNDRARFSLEVRDEYKNDFALIRGLIEFQRPKELTFTYDRGQRLVRSDIDAKHADLLQTFLKSVFASLRYERQFRIALKIALDFERRYTLERDSIYGMLQISSPANTKHRAN